MDSRHASEVVVYADGGSRGNPGPAGYGTVVQSPDGTVLAERAEYLGRATNNVAEYSGLIAGLRAAAELGARRVAVRMDSRLVVEQMSGRWQVKHPDMRPLARQAAQLVAGFDQVTFTWIPRARNAEADRLANAAMDAGTGKGGDAGPARGGAEPDLFAVPGPVTPQEPPATREPRASRGSRTTQELQASRTHDPASATGAAGASDPSAVLSATRADVATRIVVVRHGETTWGAQSRFAGRQDVPLTSRGRKEAEAVAERVRPLAPVAVLTSPLSRCKHTAQAIGVAVRAPVIVTDGLLDGLLGKWTGYRAAEIAQRWPEEFARWRSDPDVAPPGGESFTEIRGRVVPLLDKVSREYRGRTVVLVTHAATTKMILAVALDVGSAVAYRLRVDTASLSGLTVDPDGRAVVWAVNDTGHLDG